MICEQNHDFFIVDFFFIFEQIYLKSLFNIMKRLASNE